MSLRKSVLATAAFLAFAALTACRSPFVQTSIVNHTSGTVQLIEVDYPYASFGTQQIAPDSAFNYRFKILGSGPVKISFTGPDGKPYTATGPTLQSGQQGKLVITLDNAGKVQWKPELSTSR